MMKNWFRNFAQKTSTWAGSPLAFAGCAFIVLIWAAMGPAFHYSDTWQLVINTGTTIITFLMVFLIQNTQNRDSRAVHLKLDELIWANKHARNEMIDVQQLSDEELDRVHKELCEQRDSAEHRLHEIQKRKEKLKQPSSKRSE